MSAYTYTYTTSLLKYPDYRGSDQPYDENIMDQEKTGFFVDITLSNGERFKLCNTEQRAHITSDGNARIISCAIKFSKNFKAGKLRLQIHYVKPPNKTRTPLNNKNDTIENINGLVIKKDTPKDIEITGQKATDEVIYQMIDLQNTQLLPAGNVEIRLRIQNHWDVAFPVWETLYGNVGRYYRRYFHKLYMVNDECDGFIWEKKQHPNDYFIWSGYWFSGTFSYNASWIIYPEKKVVVPAGKVGNGLGNQYDITRDYVISWHNVSGGPYISVSDNGLRWVSTNVGSKPSRTSFSKNDNTGIGIWGNEIYSISIDSDGHIQKNFIETTNGKEFYINGHRFNANGYMLFTRNDDKKEFKTIYGIDSHGNIYETCLKTSKYTISSFNSNVKYELCSGGYVDPELRGIRYILISDDGFRSARELNSLQQGGLPNYGTNFTLHFPGSRILCSVRRQDAQNPSIYYRDFYGIAGAAGFTSIMENDMWYEYELCGESTFPYSVIHRILPNNITDHGTMNFQILDPQTHTDYGCNFCVFFEGGKPTVSEKWCLRDWYLGSDAHFIAISKGYPPIDVHDKEEFLESAFTFQWASLQHPSIDIIDPENDSWEWARCMHHLDP